MNVEDITADDLNKAIKAIRAEKKTESYVRIDKDYNTFLVLPYKQGIAFMQALEGAEIFERYYSGSLRTKPISDMFTMRPMSRQEYEDYKVAELLGISYNEVKQLREQHQKPKVT